MIEHLLLTGGLPDGGGVVPGTPKHMAYEVRNLPPGYGDFLELAEVQTYESQNGLNTAGTGVMSASEASADPTLSPDKMNDGNPSTYWQSKDYTASAHATSIRITFPDKRSLHHISFVRTGQSFRFFKQFEIWASDTPDDPASYTRMYHTETIDIFGNSTFWLTNRLWYVEWDDGGVDFSCIAHLTMNDASLVDRATNGTWTCANNDQRFASSQGIANLALKGQPAFIYSCRGSIGLVAYTPDTDFDLDTVDLTGLDGVNFNPAYAPMYTPLTLRVSSSVDGGQTRQEQWRCGSAREFVAGETRRFYPEIRLAHYRVDFGVSQGDQFSGWDRFRIRRKDGTYLDDKLISILASSTYNRAYHQVYVNDADSSRVWVTRAGGGFSPSWLEFALFPTDLSSLDDIGGVDVTARPDHPESTPVSIAISRNVGGGVFLPIAGASWSNYAPFGAGETRQFNVAA